MSAPETLAPPGEKREQPRSYYGQPVIKEPVWTWEIPLYFFTGGLAGASAGLAYLAERDGEEELARRSWAVSFAGIAASPALLVSDLGRPARFLNMLRLLKITSPMSVGAWLLAASGPAIGIATLNAFTGALPALARVAKPAAAALGLPLSTYTGALVANTAVPAWHEARAALPFLFGSGAAASAGAAVTLAGPPRRAAPARRLALGGAVAELVAARVMEQRLGELGGPYHRGRSGTLSRAAQFLTAAGGMALAGLARRSRAGGAAAAGAVLAGALLERWAVYEAGFASAADPRFTVGPQRRRIAGGETRGAERSVSPAAATETRIT